HLGFRFHGPWLISVCMCCLFIFPSRLPRRPGRSGAACRMRRRQSMAARRQMPQQARW
uniref:Uncharacterized protein n=1 Tax=Aegilops tauschii subsp. strangulata TaxID=200361 RepID=A0A453CMM3_AEGTS